ncbi:MAG: efflux RND transporter periplasmic adaptor subunit [Hyphomicrobiaceae bacterium]|nr:efflux RND transporter periplasmic adaptor subunit [Hyphomicrobiaceae bacterium]
MTRARVPLIIALVAAIGAAGTWGYLRARGGDDGRTVQGWIESQLIFVAPDETGRIEALSVREGDRIKVGDAIFALDAELQKAALAEAEANVANAQVAYTRAKELLARNVGSQKTFDDAEAVLRTAEARRNSAKTRLERRKLDSPVTGAVQEVYFRVGELVSAGRPIVSLLPPGNVRVRFFVPQDRVARLKIGDLVSVTCDGCPTGLVARINFISAQAEFTPPVIYSLEERARLVFRVEALPETPDALRVGQPVSVILPAMQSLADARR